MMANKLQVNRCRLCINICDDHRCLYDEDGQTNEIYALALKYFTGELLDVEWVRHLRNICMKCYRHLWEFNAYEQYVRRTHVQIYLGTDLMNSLPENNEFATDLQCSETLNTLTKAHVISTIRPIDKVVEKLCQNDEVPSDRCIPQTSKENLSLVTEKTGGIKVKREDNLLTKDEFNSLIPKSIETVAQTSSISISACSNIGKLQTTAHSLRVSQNVEQPTRDVLKFDDDTLANSIASNITFPSQTVIKTSDSCSEEESCVPGKEFAEFQNILSKKTTNNVLHPIQLVTEEESCESDDSGAEILEFDDPVGVFAGGEFDEMVENESEKRYTKSERYGEMAESVSEDRSMQLQWSGERCSSDDELPIALVAIKRKISEKEKQSSIPNSITNPKAALQSKLQESYTLNECRTTAALETNTSEGNFSRKEISPRD